MIAKVTTNWEVCPHLSNITTSHVKLHKERHQGKTGPVLALYQWREKQKWNHLSLTVVEFYDTGVSYEISNDANNIYDWIYLLLFSVFMQLFLTMTETHNLTTFNQLLLQTYRISYLFVFSIAVCFEALRGVHLDGGTADHLNAAFLILSSQGSHTAIYLKNKTTHIKTSSNGTF